MVLNVIILSLEAPSLYPVSWSKKQNKLHFAEYLNYRILILLFYLIYQFPLFVEISS